LLLIREARSTGIHAKQEISEPRNLLSHLRQHGLEIRAGDPSVLLEARRTARSSVLGKN